MRKNLIRLFVLIFMLAFLIDCALISFFYREVHIQKMPLQVDYEKFSKMDISGEVLKSLKKFCDKNDIDFSTYLSIYMAEHDYSVQRIDGLLREYNYKSIPNAQLKHLYYMIFADIECFPIRLDKKEDINRYSYVDSFLAERTYGGDRKHMGIDIMDDNNESGYFKIVSMTDGIVENIGWLELGGYRVGIRSISGAYFYYAHLSEYAADLKEGDNVQAGQLLGYMGSTGYGEEGTDDQFDVHLHIGICIIEDGEEKWVNPFSILKMVDSK
ncbi:MAG: M23 family peptidase [Firmicutes bacterium HGW-Firmicutes-7]|nr:MAG: M23 family peptidase [Firmicutes bacterium HGW-Firmicutes-7]